jgi:hypothetical protein
VRRGEAKCSSQWQPSDAEPPPLSVLALEVCRDPQADEADLHRLRPHGRGVVGHNRGRSSSWPLASNWADIQQASMTPVIGEGSGSARTLRRSSSPHRKSRRCALQRSSRRCGRRWGWPLPRCAEPQPGPACCNVLEPERLGMVVETGAGLLALEHVEHGCIACPVLTLTDPNAGHRPAHCAKILTRVLIKRKLARACDSDQHLLGGAAGNRTRVLRHSLKTSPCAVRYVSTRISRSRKQAEMTIPVAV